MKVNETKLPEVLIFEPDVFDDERGYFFETYQSDRYKKAGLDVTFVQDNLSYSKHGVLRGLHYQHPSAQGKLVTVLSGEVFDVAVDVRRGSPRFGTWVGVILSAENHRQVWIPEGFAHGFCVTGDSALFSYKCTELYNPETEQCIRWNDDSIGIDWPINEPIVSNKDMAGLPLAKMPADLLPGIDE